MIELLILYELTKKVLTMYGISKEIHQQFSVLTTPSYGTIKPALVRLEKDSCVKTQKSISSGGRPSVFYSITPRGKEILSELLLSPLQDNPIQFLTTARIRVSCADVLEKQEQKRLFKLIKIKCESIKYDIKKLIDETSSQYNKKLVFDNLMCEYNNFILLLEGLDRACGS